MHRSTPELTEAEALLATAEMAAVDRAAVASGISIVQLMEAAGRAVADAAAGDQPVAVLCGPGNNGGDGYAAARLLARDGRTVEVFASSPPKEGGAAAHHAALWRGPVRNIEAFAPGDHLLVIDALYGAGLDRPIEGAAADAISRLNASDATTLSVDMPSGVNGDTGAPLGSVVQANLTVTFFRAKPGHWLWPGRGLRGQLIVADIGLTAEHLRLAKISPTIFQNAPGLWECTMPAPAPNAHKYDRGHCLVISGSELRTGASRLAARGALNAGAGAVTLAGDRDALRIHAAHVTAVMLRESASPAELNDLIATTRFASAIIGPAAGVGDATRRKLEALLARSIPAVVDADALTSLIDHLPLLRERPANAAAVLTPHEGEFERLFGDVAGEHTGGSKLDRTRRAAALVNAVVVHKGIDTVIAAPDGRAAINGNAGPELATAGSGDVLAGIIGAHLAQGMPAFEAAASAVYLHALCGAKFGAGLTSDRLVDLVSPLSAPLFGIGADQAQDYSALRTT
jgi:hydroxyethylthiazole kinase-like uncharacterized protein yjeF